MPKARAARWFVRMVWLAAVVVGYRTLVDFGAPGSTEYTVQMLVMFGIYAAGDALLEWCWPWRDGGQSPAR
ncbi:MAG: hypothetical protein KDE27_32835 [Planctomycetes bacterium]|nr:hypothetical protein [Planctomycetota bacterium]